MTKKIITFILALFTFDFIFADSAIFTKAPKKLSKELIERSWDVEIIGIQNPHIEIIFKDNNQYSLYSPFGGDLSDGTYSFEGNKVTVNPSISVNYKYHDELFPNGNDLILFYDSEYKTMDYIGVLKNNSVILTNSIEKTPEDAQCWLNGIEVQKEIKWAEAKDNLRLRREPSLKGRTATYCYNHYFQMFTDELQKAGYEVIENNFAGPCQNLNLLLKGKYCEAIAHTIKKENIDGCLDYWYYIKMTDYTDPGWTEYYWVFGGYLKFINAPKDNFSVLFPVAMEKGILRKY